MPTYTEKIGSRNQTASGMFQTTRLTVQYVIRYCDDETIPETTEQVVADMLNAGFVIELNRPFGKPGISGAETIGLGYSASSGYSNGECIAVLEGFELTSYSFTRDTTSKGVFMFNATLEMVEYQEFNHALSIVTPSSRQIRAYRARPVIPTLAEDGTNGYTVDLLPGYANNTINGGDIGGQRLDINVSPIATPIAQNRYTLSFVSRRPYFAFANATAKTVDPIYAYWTAGNGIYFVGSRLRATNGTLAPIGTGLTSVGTGISITPIAGTWVRVDLDILQDEHAHLDQVPFSVNGFQPQDVNRFPGTGFKMLSASKVGFMDPHPLIADVDLSKLPCNVLALWQADFS